MSSKLDRAKIKNHWPLSSRDGLTLSLSPLLSSIDGVRHAFTTRHGGGSAPPLDSFNLGRHWDTDESRSDAMRNRALLCQALGLNSTDLAVPGQQHTDNIEVIKKADRGPFHYPAVDALVTGRKDQPILLHFADCVPIMIVDTKRQVLSVIHAGWRGTAKAIARKTVEKMVESLQASPGDMVAAIGPAIGSCCFKTGKDVAAELEQTVDEAAKLVDHRDGDPYPDLKAINALQLLSAGVAQVDITEWCTCCHPETFYSHRAAQGKTGRQGAMACLI